MRFTGERYSLTLPDDRPFVYLDDSAGHRIAELFVASGVDPLEGRDDTTALSDWQVEERADEIVFTVRAESSVWGAKFYRLRCSGERLRYEVAVEGDGHLAEVTYFGGQCSARPRWGSGFFLSGHAFQRVFNPEPNTEDRVYSDPAGGAVVDLTGAPLPGKRHWFFTPPPFCFGFRSGSGWLALGVEAAAGENTFSAYRYNAQDGFWLSLLYDGSAAVRGHCELPALGFDFAEDEYAALHGHIAALEALGYAPNAPREHAEWWARPMFCGWGAQCALAAREAGYLPTGDAAVDGPAFLGTMRDAPVYARQDVYESFLAALASNGVHPPTITIDDKWQASYGENDVDRTKWPDLADFVRKRHDHGGRVLLWLKAWDREGVPDAECIRNAGGLPLAVDPTNPAFERRFRRSIRRMLSEDGYGADGFKIDFTHRIPVGPGLQTYGDARGIELMKRYLQILYEEAKSIKPDALIMTHTPHPYLADVLDMIRLNDMLDLTRLDDPMAGCDIERTVNLRARVARLACPQALIDTDNWPVRNKEIWRRYLRLQPSIGVPSLYFATHIDLTQEPLDAEDYALIRETWHGIDRTG